MKRELALEFARVTEAAALAAYKWVGRGNKEAADQAAVDAMRTMLNRIAIDGEIVIGEGEIDEAPMLYIGEKVGRAYHKYEEEGEPEDDYCSPVDIAVDPVEGTRMTAQGQANAITVLAVANKGSFLKAPDMYMEKLILNPKHIEFQILADHFGNVIHLGERDCSIQRRNQKMMEESPSKALSQELREKMGNDSIKAAKKVGYVNAGTIEFVLAPDGKYYFIEMNTRIQEMVTGVDLVREQIRIAAHLKLNYKQSDIELKGHALECRINAENPQEGFRPSPGIVSSLHIPGGFGVRIDTTLYQGYQVSSHYDSMIAKVIVHGRNRIEAIRKMRRVLSELVIDGIDTNQELQYLILHESDYVKGNFDTSFIEKHLDELVNER